MGLAQPLWRALIVFRFAALGYSAVLVARNASGYEHPVAGYVVLAGMAVWTAVTAWAYASPARRSWPLLVADFLVNAGCLLASRWVIEADGIGMGRATLPMAWVAGPVLAFAVAGGRRLGGLAALGMGAVDLVVREGVTQGSVNGSVLLLLAGLVTGHVGRLAIDAEARMQRAVELEAATRERERLARGIHDSVLQVLALVQRRGIELGGDAAELGRLAGEQEATLRALVATRDDGFSDGLVDLRTLLDGRSGVSVAAPATPVWLPLPVATELAAAAGAALDNVAAHAGPDALAWLLVEDEPDAVTVTVRDNGVGFAPARLDEAEAAGRLGVAQSIRGRIRDQGGDVRIHAAPGRGTEVELRVPRG